MPGQQQQQPLRPLSERNAAVLASGLGAFLRVARRAYPEALVPDASFALAEAAAAGLPPAFGFILECWLNSAEADVDFQCYFRSGEGGKLADAVPGDSSTWRAVREVFRYWRDEAPEKFNGLWLEYDLGAGDGGLPAPRLGFARNEFGGGLDAGARAAVLSRYLDALARCRSALAPGAKADPALERTIARGLEAMPSDGYLYGTGFAPPPAVSPLRWCVSLKRLDQAIAFLRAMGWPETDAFAASLPDGGPGLSHVALNCDLSDGLGPKVGVEYYIEGKDQAEISARWREFLTRISALGLCDARWIEPLQFPMGIYTRADSPEGWPEELAMMEGLTGRSNAILSRFAHVKIVWERGAWRSGKAYLYGTYG